MIVILTEPEDIIDLASDLQYALGKGLPVRFGIEVETNAAGTVDGAEVIAAQIKLKIGGTTWTPGYGMLDPEASHD